MIVTDEPGIYIPGQFGIRIEDTVLINKGTCEPLTKSNKKYVIVRQNYKRRGVKYMAVIKDGVLMKVEESDMIDGVYIIPEEVKKISC